MRTIPLYGLRGCDRAATGMGLNLAIHDATVLAQDVAHAREI